MWNGVPSLFKISFYKVEQNHTIITDYMMTQWTSLSWCGPPLLDYKYVSTAYIVLSYSYYILNSFHKLFAIYNLFKLWFLVGCREDYISNARGLTPGYLHEFVLYEILLWVNAARWFLLCCYFPIRSLIFLHVLSI